MTDNARRWTLDDLAEELRSLRSAAGHPSYAEIARRIARERAGRGVPAGEQRPARATVYDCFRLGRSRVDIDLVVEIARALGADDAEATRWAQVCRAAQHQADAATVVTVHADLPAAIEHFVGREAALETILGAGTAGDEPARGPVFSIEGMPGSGKSQLAIRAARRLLDDGRAESVLYADLRGFHPDSPPADPAAVLDAFLRLLDVPAREIPAGLAQRQALYLEKLHAGRYVVVLDDAVSPEQARPLLPAEPDAVVLLTSRTALGTALGATRVQLEAFTPAEAVALLREVAGTELVDTDVAAATELVAASGFLPLAVGLTAIRVAARAGWSLADHVESLIERRRGLRLDDAVQATLDLSYTALTPGAQATLRLLAAHPCTDLDLSAVAALTGREAGEVAGELEHLVAHHLVLQPRPRRYALHSLVRTYALDRSYDDDRPAERDAARGRLCDHVVGMIWAVYENLHNPVGSVNRTPPPHVRVPAVDQETAHEWMEPNVENILTLASQASDLGRPGLALDLSGGAAWWLNRYGRYRDARLLHRLALDVAAQHGSRVDEARVNLDLGQILVRLTEWESGAAHLGLAERVFDDLGDLHSLSSALNAMAVMEAHLGRLDEAIDRFRRCAELASTVGNQRGLAIALDNIAIVHRRAGRLDDAVEYHRKALEQAVAVGERYMEGSGLINLSEVYLLLGDLEAALEAAKRGLAIAQDLDNTPIIAYGNDNLGSILSASGDHQQALAHYTVALELSGQIGDRHLEAGVLNNLGITYLRTGDVAQARRYHDDAHGVSTKGGDSFEQARALDGIGATLAADGDLDGARRHWTDALAIFDQLGAPEAAEVRARLATSEP